MDDKIIGKEVEFAKVMANGSDRSERKGKRGKYSKFTKHSKSDKQAYSKNKGSEIPSRNDWKFYAASDQIARDVASLPFNYLGGTPFKIAVKTGPSGTKNVTRIALPPVMSVDYINAIGKTSIATEGVNMAAAQLYTAIRQKNSGAKNYEAPDVMMYVLAMREIYTHFFSIKRLIGIVGMYNFYNHSLPDALIKAAGFDPDNLRQNIAQYRGRLNLLARKINSFAVPKYFKMFDRAAYINSFVFGDSDSVRGQIYMFKNVGYFKWSAKTSDKGTELAFNKLLNYKLTTLSYASLESYLDLVDDLITTMFQDEDVLTMSGDILKAFPDSELYGIAETPEGYTIDIKYDVDILAQIENSNAVLPAGIYDNETTLGGSDGDQFDVNIRQDNQVITQGFKITSPGVGTNAKAPYGFYLLERVLNSHKNNPDYTDVLEWTRLCTVSDITVATSGITVNVESCGLELTLGYTLYFNDFGSNANTLYANHFGYVDQAITLINGTDFCKWTTNVGTTPRSSVLASHLSMFDWRPFTYALHSAKTDAEPVFCGDVKVATIIYPEDIERINDAAVYGAMYMQ